MTTKTSTHAVATYHDGPVFGYAWGLWITGPVYKNSSDPYDKTEGAYVGLIPADKIDEALVKADAKVEAFIADDTLMLARTIYKKDVL